MDLEPGFLADIIANPEDDAPRLVYADWLDENGDEPRAELIRLQIAIAAGHASPEMLRREAELLGLHAAFWAGDVAGHAGEVLYRRGLLEGIDVEGPDDGFPAAIERWSRKHPLRLLRFDEMEEAEVDAVAALIESGRILPEMLDVSMDGSFGPKWLTRIVPHAASLRSLLLEHVGSSEEWEAELRALATHPGPLAGLTELGLGFGTHDDPLPQGTVEAFIAGDAFPDLTRLHVPFARLGEEAVARLGESPRWARLTHLDLGCCHIPLEGWRRLAWGPNTPRLQWLGLIGGHVVLADGEWESLRTHAMGDTLRGLLGERADFDTSSTFPRWKGSKV